MTIDTDYLVLGAGAMGMAFTDVVLTETDATITLVDRQGRPGGHWNHAYPFVRLHQPSSFYGVDSRPLGGDAKDVVGWNAGLFELATGTEVLAYFDQVLNQQFLPSGRVRYLPMHDVGADGGITSRVTGATVEVGDRPRVVDATYMNVTVPAMRPPPYTVADGVSVVPPNGLTGLTARPSRYVIVGAGKTGMDACLWLLANGTDPDAITWIMPRDSWVLDRANIQPGPEFVARVVNGFVGETTASAWATSIDDLFDRLEAGGQLLRLDPRVRPTMYRCATVTTAELDQLRRIDDVVRAGRVRSISASEIELDDGTVATDERALYVDCTADGLERRPVVPVFDSDRITLQTVRACQQVFSAAFIGYVEAAYDDATVQNELATVVPHPDTEVDWLRVALGGILNRARWAEDPGLSAWLAESRLDPFSGNQVDLAEIDPAIIESVGTLLEHTPGAITNLQRLIEEADETPD